MSKVLDALREACEARDVRRILELSEKLPNHTPPGPPIKYSEIHRLDWHEVPVDELIQCGRRVEQDCQSIGHAYCPDLATHWASTGVIDSEGREMVIALCRRHYAHILPYITGYQHHRAARAELCAGSGI